MAAKGYCTHTDVSNFLGMTFTTAQNAYADSLVEAAENMVDTYTRRSWLMGVQTLETHWLTEDWRGEPYQWGGLLFGGKLYLKHAPLTSLDSLYGRMGLQTNNILLTAGTDYEVVDLVSGLVTLVFPTLYDRLQATYTPAATVPPMITLATAELIAWWMQPSLRSDSYGLFSYSLPDLSVRFAFHTEDPIPGGVASKLDLFAYPTHA